MRLQDVMTMAKQQSAANDVSGYPPALVGEGKRQSECHLKAQMLVACFDGGMDISYPEFTDMMFALAYQALPADAFPQHDHASDDDEILEKISYRLSALNA